jgi:xanthine dehydrogenase small subunit
VAQLDETESSLEYRALNSCVTFMSALEGKQLLTVEHIGNPEQPHPVQKAMVEHHGSQCGFCTPGFVMSLFALYQNNEGGQAVQRADVINTLSGNLCRCTGYRPIIDAALDVCNQPLQPSETSDNTADVVAQLKSLQTSAMSGHDSLKIPKNRQQLAEAVAAWPEAAFVAGSTDIALQVTQQLKPLQQIISLTHVKELQRIEDNENELVIGAGCSLNRLQTPLLNAFPEIQEIIERFASVPIRNQATLGGNVANASPIGDMPPVLIALNACVVIDNGKTYRTVPIKDFFVGYRQTVLADGEWLDSIVVPKPAESKKSDRTLRAYKVSKRIEDDISAVCAVFNIEVENDVVKALSAGFGGVAATPETGSMLEDALLGAKWSNQACVKVGADILQKAFSPIDDVRASADYRQQLLGNLWHRFWLESRHEANQIETRVVSHA